MKQNIFCAVFASQYHWNRDICAVVCHSRQTSFHTASLCSPHMYSMCVMSVSTESLCSYMSINVPEGLSAWRSSACYESGKVWIYDTRHSHACFAHVHHICLWLSFLKYKDRSLLHSLMVWTHLVNVSGVCLCKTCRYNVWAFLVFAWALLIWCYYDCFFLCIMWLLGWCSWLLRCSEWFSMLHVILGGWILAQNTIWLGFNVMNDIEMIMYYSFIIYFWKL